MAYIADTAPLGVRSRFAEFVATVRKSLASEPGFPRTLSDHIARDIGLSAHDLETLRHEMPSRSTNHPML